MPRMVIATARRKSSTWNSPSSSRNVIRLRLARLQAVSSRNMYSEQGLLELMRPEAFTGFQRLMVRVVLDARVAADVRGVGHLPKQIARLVGVDGLAVVTARVCQPPSARAACMKVSVTRTEWLAFWKKTES